MRKYILLCPYLLFFLNIYLPSAAQNFPWETHGKLKVSGNGHYLEHEDGMPFLWIGDTGWALFSQLDQSEVIEYLDNRKKTGFNVIQAVAFWFPHGGNLRHGPSNATNAYGHRPFVGGLDAPDTDKPLVINGSNAADPDDYWDQADFVINAVKERGMYLALLPCWGSAYVQGRIQGSHIEFTEPEALAYGRFLGNRYKGAPHIIWVLGGDIDPVHHGDKDQRSVYRAMAEGIGQGLSGNQSLKWDDPHPDWNKTLMTFHAVQSPPQGKGGSSSNWFHKDPWLDINMLETWAWNEQIYPLIHGDYKLTNPVKPTIMGEGAYEYGKYLDECGWVTPRRVRQQAYHSFFAGAIGHTYGAYPVWPMRGEECGMTWKTAIQLPGAYQVATVMRKFLNENNWQNWIPAQELVLDNKGEGEHLKVAVQAGNDAVLIYFPVKDSVLVDLKQFDAPGNIKISWFNPEDWSEFKPAEQEIEANKAWFHPPGNFEDAILRLQSKN